MSFLLKGSIPATVPVHWGLDGQPDRYGSRLEGLLFVPIMLLVLGALFGLIGAISGGRLKSNATKGLNLISIGIVVTFICIHFMLLTQNYGLIPRMLPFFFSFFLILIGSAMRGIEPNPFIGIRVPWTMKSPLVWRLTHERASRLCINGGIVSLIFAVVGVHFAVSILIFVGCLLVPVYDSYLISKKA